MNGTEAHHAATYFYSYLLILLLGLAWAVYVYGGILSNKRHRPWPLHRTVCWTLGIASAAVSVIGPLADRAHSDFPAHMIVHLLLGMLTPLLLVLAAPMTLLLRVLRVSMARKLTLVLKNRLLRFYTHPIATSIINIGGLWVLYATELYAWMNESTLVHGIVHLHVLTAGYLFTISILHIDPIPHRLSYAYRSVVLIAALAGHGILSKYIYAHPPAGIPLEQAELGAMIMYYGGDMIDAFLIFMLCLQWYQSSRRKGTTITFPAYGKASNRRSQ
jgi:putative membrane protein